MMLMRNCVVLFGYTQGVIAVVLMWLPTELMTRLVTPHVLAQLSLAYAIGVRNKSVLDEMMEDATAEGDYAAAGQVTLTLTLTPTLKPYTVTVTAHHSPLTFHPSPHPHPPPHPHQVLEMALTHELTKEEIEDEEIVRAKVKDLLKLGEMKWRYRVVEEGQNPRDEAIKVQQLSSHLP